MIIYSLTDPDDYRFASALRRGTWSASRGKCPECGAPGQERISPLVIEWQADSDLIGDFTWPGFNDEAVVTDRVRDAFEEAGLRCLQFMPVEMVQASSLRRPAQMTKRSKPRVWLPYKGPLLWDVQPNCWVGLDLPRSGVRLKRTCSTCGRQNFEGPPLQERYLVVDRSTWGGEEFFRVRQFPALIFCTQVAVDFVLTQGFTNFGYRRQGEIPD